MVIAGKSTAEVAALEEKKSRVAATKPFCAWAQLFLQEQIARGKSHASAVRSLAFKWQRIMFVCWRDRAPYDENAYLAALQKRGSFLHPRLADSLQRSRLITNLNNSPKKPY